MLILKRLHRNKSVSPTPSSSSPHDNNLQQKQQHQHVVAMESSSLRNLQLNEKDEEGLTKIQKQQQRDYYQCVKNDPKPSSEKENLENLIHLKRALVKSDQKEVPGESKNVYYYSN